MNLTVIFTIIIMHFIADFIFQDEVWALGKSKKLAPLLKHTSVYSIMWIIPMFFLFWGEVHPTMIFVGVTFIAHTITDYFTSRVVSKRFDKKHFGSPIPNFGAFTIIGFDQVLHYVQLFLTYYILTK